MKAVIFDMDGLMLDSEKIYRDAWRIAGAEYGVTVDGERYAELIGLRDDAGDRLIRSWVGEDFPLRDFKDRWLAEARRLEAENGVDAKPGLERLLDYLEEQEIDKAVATSTLADDAYQRLGDYRERFTTVITGDQVEHGKPAPDIFLAAAQALGVEAGECLVLEDAEPGVQAALAAGMAVILVPDLRPPSQAARRSATAVRESLDDVLAWLRDGG